MASVTSVKSTTKEIQERFDKDVDRFANLEVGQQAVIDAKIMLDLISGLAVRIVPHVSNLLDIGCGAGNNTISVVREKSGLNCHLVDLSLPMLEKAQQRLASESIASVEIYHEDLRTVDLPHTHYDIIIAAAVLHHLRDDDDWKCSFQKIFNLLRPNGAFFVSDMVSHADPSVHESMWHRYGSYLENLGGVDYKDTVFDYIDREDSPRDLTFQIDLMREVGFTTIDILHKNSCFAAYVGIKK